MTDGEKILIFSEEVFLYGLLIFCFAAPAILTLINICNLIFFKDRIIPKTAAMLTVWLGAALYALLLAVFTELYPGTIPGFAVLLLVFGVLGIFILLIAAWNYPKERLLPSTVRVFRISFIAANVLHLAFAALLIPHTKDVFLMMYVYHVNLVLITISAVKKIKINS